MHARPLPDLLRPEGASLHGASEALVIMVRSIAIACSGFLQPTRQLDPLHLHLHTMAGALRVHCASAALTVDDIDVITV